MKIEILKEKVPNTTGHIINYQPYNYHLLLTDEDELSSSPDGAAAAPPPTLLLSIRTAENSVEIGKKASNFSR